jgi:hypothetical protein
MPRLELGCRVKDGVRDAWVHMIPSWHQFNFVAPVCFSIASIAVLVFSLWRKGPRAQQTWWQLVLRVCVTLLLVTLVLASLWLSVFIAALAPPVERTYTFEGSRQPLYMVENPCWPPDNSTECDEYWTEIRTPIGFFPFTRTITRCDCFYDEPEVTPRMIKFPVEYTYVPDTPPAIIDRRTMRLLAGRPGPGSVEVPRQVSE